MGYLACCYLTTNNTSLYLYLFQFAFVLSARLCFWKIGSVCREFIAACHAEKSRAVSQFPTYIHGIFVCVCASAGSSLTVINGKQCENKE